MIMEKKKDVTNKIKVLCDKRVITKLKENSIGRL